MKNQGEGSEFNSTFTISFDTQFPSYLRARSMGKSIPGQDDAFTECLRFLEPFRRGTDIMPYLFENQDRIESRQVRETIAAFLQFRTADSKILKEKGEVCSLLSQHELDGETDGILDLLRGPDWQVLACQAKVNWAISYMVLLLAARVHFKHQTQKSIDRLAQLFIHLDEFGLFPKTEIHFAHKFFEQGNQESFFRHIQGNGKNLISRLANMAWDFSHKRTILGQVTATARVFTDQADFVVPYLLTFDRSLQGLLHGYQLNGLISYLQDGVKFIEIYPKEVGEKISQSLHQCAHLLEPEWRAARISRGHHFLGSEARREESINRAERLLERQLQSL